MNRYRWLTVRVLLAVLLAGGLYASPAAAEDERWYEVQIIIFEHRTGESSEQWPVNPALPDLSGAQNLRGYAGRNRRIPFSRVLNPGRVLQEQWKKLEDSDNYRPLMRTAWIQPGQERGNAQAVRIRDSETLDLPDNGGAWGTHAGEGQGRHSGPIHRIDGTITVSLGRYLHLETNLVYSEVLGRRRETDIGEVETDTPGWLQEEDARLQRYVHKQSRRMRSNELHYIDHPRFGVLAKIEQVD